LTDTNSQLGPVGESIAAKLMTAFAPRALRVIDESAMHGGHAGARPEGESHFRVQIVSEAFTGMNRVARHRAVNDALTEQFEAGLHALAIQAQTPEEAGRTA